MPSKNKKARGKARRAAKSRKEEEVVVKNGIESEMQRLQINKEADDEALLEEAINLAAAEREELEAAAKNDEVSNSQICNHGLVPLSKRHVCKAFLKSFVDEYNEICESNLAIYDLFQHIYEAMKITYAKVWIDSEKIQWVASSLIIEGTGRILQGDYSGAALYSIFSCFLEQCATTVAYQKEAQLSTWNIFDASCDWTKMCELYEGDEHTLVSFYRKRIPCKCLDNKYKEVKSIKKIGFCQNDYCQKKTIRCEMLSCTQCREANYCSKECQAAHWPTHKQICITTARRLAARKSSHKTKAF